MTSIREAVRRMLQPARPLPAGLYHYQAPPDDPRNYRLHLRLEPDGSGLLVVNASTILHLNLTASEYAYHLVNQTEEAVIAQNIAKRYRVSQEQALQDYRDFKERIDILIDRQDLDPEIFLDLEPVIPGTLTAPLRLDCALTYRLPTDPDRPYYHAPAPVPEMSTQEWQQILDQAWNFGILQVIFTGGEPTLRDDLLDLIRQAEYNGQVAGLVSDGFRMLEPVYLQNILQSGLDHIILLLQPMAETSWQVLAKLVEADLFVTVHITVTPVNKNLIEEALERVASMGVHALSLSESDPSLTDTLFALRDRAAHLDIPLVWGLPVPYPSLHPLSLEPEQGDIRQSNAWLYVDPDGVVSPDPTSPATFGNARDETWDVIWGKISSA